MKYYNVMDNMLNDKSYIHESSYVDQGVLIGEGSKVWHFTHIQTNAVIGENCNIGQNVNISKNVIIGNNVKIQNNVSIYEGVELGDHVFCGPSCVFTNDLNPRCEFPKGHSNYKKTIVRNGATIGANATIICGIKLGEYCLVGAGAVVTKDVPQYALVTGNPASIVGYVCKCGERLPENMSCVTCNREYTVTDNIVNRKYDI